MARRGGFGDRARQQPRCRGQRLAGDPAERPGILGPQGGDGRLARQLLADPAQLGLLAVALGPGRVQVPR